MVSYVKLSTWSNNLKMCVPIDIMLPDTLPEGQEKAKVLYLLHGLSDDETCWGRRTALERYIDCRGLCVVMPAGHRSFYTDISGGADYFSYISQELPQIIKKFFNVSSKREDTFIGGVSMGGYGCIKAALRCPEQYSVAVPISGVLTDVKEYPWVFPEYESVFGQTMSPQEDPMQLLELCSCGLQPKILQFCGKDDFLHRANIEFFEKAQELGYDISYFEDEGAHGWDYWDKTIRLIVDMLCPQ